MMTFIYFLSIALLLLLCVLLCGTILIQESKSSGLGASFGGDSGDSRSDVHSRRVKAIYRMASSHFHRLLRYSFPLDLIHGAQNHNRSSLSR